MKSSLLTHLGAIGVVSVGLLAGTGPAPDYSNSFSAVLTGDVRATVSGAATFGRISGGPTTPDVFTVTLGADTSDGAVLFTQPIGGGLSVGSYRISDVGFPGEVQALVVLGSSGSAPGSVPGLDWDTHHHLGIRAHTHWHLLSACQRLLGLGTTTRGPAGLRFRIVYRVAQELNSQPARTGELPCVEDRAGCGRCRM